MELRKKLELHPQQKVVQEQLEEKLIENLDQDEADALITQLKDSLSLEKLTHKSAKDNVILNKGAKQIKEQGKKENQFEKKNWVEEPDKDKAGFENVLWESPEVNGKEVAPSAEPINHQQIYGTDEALVKNSSMPGMSNIMNVKKEENSILFFSQRENR